MCGRFVATTPVAQLLSEFAIDGIDQRTERNAVLDPPRYNIAPRSTISVVRQEGDRRVLSAFRWGLVPSWAKDLSIGDKLTNARAETLAEKPSFRAAFAKRRCIIPADGYYEWKRSAIDPKKKQPVYFTRRDGHPLAFAGLWEVWRDPANPEAVIRTTAIITTEPNAFASVVHSRMPAILEHDMIDDWLDSKHEVSEVRLLLQSAPEDVLNRWEVSTLVNRASVDVPELIRPLEPDALF
ncbi:MAG: SOS response-associated peptidase [Acidimicrobiia bacterium]